MGKVLHMPVRRVDAIDLGDDGADIEPYTKNLVLALQSLRGLDCLSALAYKIGLMAVAKMQAMQTIHVEISIYECERNFVETDSGVPLARPYEKVLTARQFTDACNNLNVCAFLGMLWTQEFVTFDPTPELDEARDRYVVSATHEGRTGSPVMTIT